MWSRWVRIFFAGLWLLWAGVIIPGHTRGVIPLTASAGCHDGSARRGDAWPACCVAKPGHAAPDSPKERPRDPHNCAICYIAGHLPHAPFALAAPVKLGLLEVRPIAAGPRVELPAIVLSIQCRGPPVA